ncbi:MAG TPA: exodeoxyribonuclease III [Vicinamibacterales bacterium]|nr:exodeoxyribonuclease III [Vicinamibacterales bacterium]
MLKVASWNVNGIRARQSEVQEWIDRERPDIVCLQELKATSDQVPTALCEMEGYWCYWHGGKGYSGVGLHISKALAPDRPVFSHPPFDFETRIAAVDLPTPFGPVTVASIYVPNGGKDFPAKMQFLQAMLAYAEGVRAGAGRLVLCGDLNVARSEKDVTIKERNPTVIGQRPDERALFERILATGLVDVGRSLDPDNETLFTWWPPWRGMRQKNRGWRIDYVLASESLRATECRVLAEVGTSDHAPVVATFA